MSGIDNPIIFYPASALIILFALFAIGFKNIFRSLLSAIVVFFLTGLFFYILGSEYNAVIQIAIYGIAVPVVLGLAIMFTNTQKILQNDSMSKMRYFLILSVGIFILAMVYLVLTSLAIMPIGFNVTDEMVKTSMQTFSAFSNGIFVRYVWAFELVSLILTIVVVGLTLFRRINRCKK